MTPADGVAPPSAPDDIRTVHDRHVIERIYDRLIVPNFPGDERIPVEQLAAAITAGKSAMRIVGDPDDPIAMAITERLDGNSVELLAYFATRADQRGRGVGTRLLSSIIERVRQEPGATVLLAEVEHPAHHEAHEVHGDPVARLRFYGRLGARVLDVPYFQPPVDPASPPVYGMALLALDVPPAFECDGRLMIESGIDRAVAALVARVDPAALPVAPLLAAVREHSGVSMLPIARINDVAVPIGD